MHYPSQPTDKNLDLIWTYFSQIDRDCLNDEGSYVEGVVVYPSDHHRGQQELGRYRAFHSFSAGTDDQVVRHVDGQLPDWKTTAKKFELS